LEHGAGIGDAIEGLPSRLSGVVDDVEN